MAVNAIELAEDLRARTDLSPQNASGIAYAITRAVESGTSALATRDHLDAELAKVRTEIAGLRAELKQDISGLRAELKQDIFGLRAELHRVVRGQTVWLTGTMIALSGLILAIVKLVP